MALTKFQATVMIPQSGVNAKTMTRTIVEAQSALQAKNMLESMYGKGCLVGYPVQVGWDKR